MKVAQLTEDQVHMLSTQCVGWPRAKEWHILLLTHRFGQYTLSSDRRYEWLVWFAGKRFEGVQSRCRPRLRTDNVTLEVKDDCLYVESDVPNAYLIFWLFEQLPAFLYAPE